MSCSNELTRAFDALDQKLDALGTMTEVNSFLVAALREHEHDLMRMSPQETRALLRRKAREKYRTDGGETPNPAALELLEETLGTGQTADVIPFPQSR